MLQKNPYDYLSVPETASLLETPATNVYALVRRGVLNNSNITKDPILISESQVFWYLNQRLPSKFRATYIDEKMVA